MSPFLCHAISVVAMAACAGYMAYTDHVFLAFCCILLAGCFKTTTGKDDKE